MTDSLGHSHVKVHNFLKHHPMAVLSTADNEGMPWGSAVFYVADDDFNFYFITRVETRKFENLDKNPVASITIADEEHQTTVQASGKVSRVPVKDYMEIVFDKLASIKPKDDHAWSPPIDKLHKGNYMPFRLTPSHLQYADYKLQKTDENANYVEVII